MHKCSLYFPVPFLTFFTFILPQSFVIYFIYVESADQIFAFTNANEFQDLVDHIKGVIQVSQIDNYGVMISQSMTVGFWSRAMAFVPLLIAISI